GELDEAEALDTGADDFLTKPFSFVVLTARLRALMRRGAPARPAVLTARGLQLDPASHLPWPADDEPHPTAREFALLALLLRRVRPRRRLRPLRRWFLASVRARTTALSMLVVAAALAVCAISLVVIISRSLVRNVDETNLTRAEDVAARARAGALGRIIPVSG